jgi:signal peptidase I
VPTIARRLLVACRFAVLAVTLAAVVVLVAGHVLGWTALIVRSGSMEPSVPVGSLVLARPVQPGDVRLGDVVAVPREIDGARVLVLHRVVDLRERGGRLQAQLRGDANPVPDPEPDVLDRPVARGVAVVPVAGYAVAAMRVTLTPSRLLLVALGVLGLALIWRRPRHRPRINGRVSTRPVE